MLKAHSNQRVILEIQAAIQKPAQRWAAQGHLINLTTRHNCEALWAQPGLASPQIYHIFLKGHCLGKLGIIPHNPQKTLIKILFGYLFLSSKLPTHSTCQKSLLSSSLPAILFSPMHTSLSAPAPLLLMRTSWPHLLGKDSPVQASEFSSCQKVPPRMEWMKFSTSFHIHHAGFPQHWVLGGTSTIILPNVSQGLPLSPAHSLCLVNTCCRLKEEERKRERMKERINL